MPKIDKLDWTPLEELFGWKIPECWECGQQMEVWSIFGSVEYFV